MNKKLLALAVAGALAAPLAAHAEVTVYGHIDASVDSIDVASKADNSKRVVTQASSNTSYIGFKGWEDLGGGLRSVWQIESDVNVTGTPGGVKSNDASNTFASRDSFVGLAGSWGSVKIGKSDTPYKRSTGYMDPFSNGIGDYNSIMGNSGGDNRTEFNARQAHALWYDSPDMNGTKFSFMYAPGQAATGAAGIPQGEPVCNGGNSSPCTDGGYTSNISAMLSHDFGALKLVGAYERHANVDRSSDATGIGQANEQAYKVGASYTFANVGNTVNAIFERLQRGGPADDRTSNRVYLSDVQNFSGNNQFMVAWAHANSADNTAATTTSPNKSVLDDGANLYAIGVKHNFSKRTSVYGEYAAIHNKAAGHFGLGESGHGIVSDPSSTYGLTLSGVSVGMVTKF